eukprot:9250963-Pyramimonas_sp.AAC.1
MSARRCMSLETRLISLDSSFFGREATLSAPCCEAVGVDGYLRLGEVGTCQDACPEPCSHLG